MRRRRTPTHLAVFVAAMAALCAPAHAAVEDTSPAGFTVTQTANIAASPERVYDAIVAPARWWSSDHTYSQNASNLTLDARAGGCWCETLPGGGSVQHLVVVNAMPAKMLRLRGALGPLQGMAVDGSMTFALHAANNATQLIMTYTVGGYSKSGVGELANAVDSVLAEQVARLRLFVETGKPDAAPTNRH